MLFRSHIWTAIQHASITKIPPQESYPANPLVLSCSNKVIAFVQHTIALTMIHNVSNNSYFANKNITVFSLVATTHPPPCMFLSLERGKQGGMNPLSSIKFPLRDTYNYLARAIIHIGECARTTLQLSKHISEASHKDMNKLIIM